MKIGIQISNNSFSTHWVDYCESNNIAYKKVDCYASDIIQQLSDCYAFMWHFHQGNPKDILFAKQLIFAIEATGVKVFPDFHTMWHFDDKVAQKYLLEAIQAPLIPSWVFYDKMQALNWVKTQQYPLVFKLRCGAGSGNVRLVSNKTQAIKLVNKSFEGGFSQYSAKSNLKERIRKYRIGQTTLFDVAKGVVRLAYQPKSANVAGKERGYIYFQEFVPDNTFDIRVIVIGDKSFAIKRMVRKNDFRASGSGNILYEKKHFDDTTIALAFQLCKKLKSQCIAFDFVYKYGKPLVVEISYGFSPEAYVQCTGFWDENMTWYEGEFNPCGWMLENLRKSLKQ